MPVKRLPRSTILTTMVSEGWVLKSYGCRIYGLLEHEIYLIIGD